MLGRGSHPYKKCFVPRRRISQYHPLTKLVIIDLKTLFDEEKSSKCSSTSYHL